MAPGGIIFQSPSTMARATCTFVCQGLNHPHDETISGFQGGRLSSRETSFVFGELVSPVLRVKEETNPSYTDLRVKGSIIEL